MKRSEYIVPLSKDHHFGLLCSWKIQKGLDKNIALNRITAYVDFFGKIIFPIILNKKNKLFFLTLMRNITNKLKQNTMI